MHLEIRTIGKKKKYYLSHSYKKEGKVKKIRRYLGKNLSEKEIKKLRPQAEKAIKEQLKLLQKINDPLKTVLSKEEIEELNSLIAKGNLRIKHLNEKEWLRFTEIFTFNTNAIEGSAIILSEVKKILEKDQWPEDATKEDVSETYGVAEAISFIRKTEEHISLELIKKIHQIVFKNSKSFAGKFREKGVEVGVVNRFGEIIHQGAPSTLVVSLLKELIRWYNKGGKKYHPLVLAAVVHNQFENIHPFQDGNGRVGRILLNNVLLKHDLPPVNIELKHRFEYYHTLQQYERESNLRPTIEFILKEYQEFKKQFR